MLSESEERGNCDSSCKEACHLSGRIFRDFHFSPEDFAIVERLDSPVVPGRVILISRIFRALLESVCEGFELFGTDGLDLGEDGPEHSLCAWWRRE